MPRPSNKQELIETSQTNYKKLLDYIDGLKPSAKNQEFSTDTMNRNIRDVLVHLHEWNLMTHGWYTEGMANRKPEMPAPSYTWKTLPALNKKIWADGQSIALKTARKKFESSFQQLQDIISHHSNEDLFTKKKYKWTGSTSLGSYLVSSASSHYVWALKLIKKGLKRKKKLIY